MDDQEEPEEQFVSVGPDLRLCYNTFGDPASKDAILLIMGLGAPSVAWRTEFCKLLVTKGYFVIRYDNRDVGLSTRLSSLGNPPIISTAVWNFARDTLAAMSPRSSADPGTPYSPIGAPPSPKTPKSVEEESHSSLNNGKSGFYSLDDMARDGFALLNHLGIEKAHIAGVSMGGMIGQCMLLLDEARILSLTSIMSTTGDPDLPGPAWRLVPSLLKRKGADHEARVQASVDFFSMAGSPKYFSPERHRGFVEMSFRRCPADDGVGTARQLNAIMTAPARGPFLGRVTRPVLVIHGRVDPLVKLAHGQRTAHVISTSELLVVEDMAHDLPPELWDDIVSRMRAVADRGNQS